MSERHREQVADLILKGPYGRDLVICSDLDTISDPGSCSFETMDPETGQHFTVTVTQVES